MGMAVNHGGQSGCGGVQVQDIQVMQDVKLHPAHLHHPVLGKFAGPVRPYRYCPAPPRPGRFSRPRQDLRAADIPGMDDEFHALQGRNRLGPQQPVGIGDDADEMFSHTGSQLRTYLRITRVLKGRCNAGQGKRKRVEGEKSERLKD